MTLATVLAIWAGFFLLCAGYSLRDKPVSRLLLRGCAAVFCIAALLFVVWAVLRAVSG